MPLPNTSHFSTYFSLVLNVQTVQIIHLSLMGLVGSIVRKGIMQQVRRFVLIVEKVTIGMEQDASKNAQKVNSST